MGTISSAVDSFHRSYIRDVVFCVPLGFILSMSVGQQYGFSSEFLDVTTSPEIAGFFATHPSKRYNEIECSNELGVIYCFPKPELNLRTKTDVMSIRSSNAPPGVDIRSIVAPFEMRDPDFGRAIEVYVQYALDALETSDPQWEYLALPKNWLDYSRIGRQYAGVLIPYEIRKPYESQPKPFTKEGFVGLSRKLPEILAVEDLLSRPGVRAYCFKHTDVALNKRNLKREYLWPSDSDFFLMVTKSLLMLGPDIGRIYYGTGYPYTHVPKRPDLVDAGYYIE